MEIASDSLTVFAVRQAQLEAERFRLTNVPPFASKFRALIEQASAHVKKEIHVSAQSLIEALTKATDIGDPQAFLEEMHEQGNLIKQQLLTQGKYPRSYIHRVGELLSCWLETSRDVAYTHILSRYMTKTGPPSTKLEVVALDPAKVTAPIFSSIYCSVSMSGTLQTRIVCENHAAPDSTVCQAVPSPFSREHIFSLACCGVHSNGASHTSHVQKLVKRITEVAHNTPANVGIFAALYEVLKKLLDARIEAGLEKPVLPELRGMRAQKMSA